MNPPKWQKLITDIAAFDQIGRRFSPMNSEQNPFGRESMRKNANSKPYQGG
jgi:hypothetical protein